MHFAFGLRQDSEDSDGARLDACVEPALLDAPPDVPLRHVAMGVRCLVGVTALMTMTMVMIVIVMMVMMRVRVRCGKARRTGGFVGADVEATARQHTIRVPRVFQSQCLMDAALAYRRDHRSGQLRTQVQQGCHEHLSGQASDQVKVNVQTSFVAR
jgi:hypothetical protein